MIEISNIEVIGWENAVRGMRNPMNSWEKSDTDFIPDEFDEFECGDCGNCRTFGSGFCRGLGDADWKLMKTLAKAGTDHRKFMRMIVVYVDIIAPLYWWKEFDTYKVGTVANSCSTMHKIAAKKFEMDDFSHEHLRSVGENCLENIIQCLNEYRMLYLESKDKSDWWQLIQLLPSSYNQRRTVMLNYEVLANIYKSRKHHKLDEWNAKCEGSFCQWIESLPYSELITGGDANE